MEKGDPQAVTLARRAAELMPNNPDIGDTLGWVLVKNGQLQEGLRVLRRSAADKPDSPDIQFHLAWALDATGDVDGAREALGKALATPQFQSRAEAEALAAKIGL